MQERQTVYVAAARSGPSTNKAKILWIVRLRLDFALKRTKVVIKGPVTIIMIVNFNA